MQQVGEKGMVNGSPADDLQAVKAALAGANIQGEQTEFLAPAAPRRSKIKMSIEKKIEHIWLEAKEQGWSYNEFVAYLLEVLVVLNHRSLLPTADHNKLGKNGFLPE